MRIVYTLTDEAPALATHSLLPIIEAFAGAADVEVEPSDISLAGRILAQFPDRLSEDQRAPDALTELGELAKTPEANVIKTPNISASVPQLKAAIAELQEQGYDIPDYPHEAYDKVKGSAVNPVLRQGNSDRRAPESVKNYARKHPHSMGEWSSQSRSHVSTMSDGDFRATEQSVTVPSDGKVTIEHSSQGVLRAVDVKAGEIIDAAVMHCSALDDFLAAQVNEAKEQGVLFSVHLKATMMKVSDPIIFGHAVRAYFGDIFSEVSGVSPNDGVGALEKALDEESDEKAQPVRDALAAALADGPPLAMVDSDRGITNLHVPSDVIIDASMPAAIRTSGQMWNPDGDLQDTKYVIPDHSYAALYAETLDHCREHGAFDPSTMGTTPNVGLMAQAAEEYGSHDKTYEIEQAGSVRVLDADGNALLEHDVEPGDIWRMCQTKRPVIEDWVKLAVGRARATGWPAVFWLDETRAHDEQVLQVVRAALEQLDTDGLEIKILDVAEATRYTLARARAGHNTISVTGNVLRDYLTDLFPILELGTSAKMQSIVPLMAGGGLFETGAGGSAPKHVQQFLKENHLRWDSLGEFLALGPSLELVGTDKAKLLAEALDEAIGRFLEENKSPSRKVGELDIRGSHFYLTLYWAQALAGCSDKELATKFAPLAATLAADEEKILEELNSVQGEAVDVGGYYRPDLEKATAAMRPSATFNEALASL
jgi:isocitrate dehydrogenase